VSIIASVVLNGAAALIILGGLYDLFVAKLPHNLAVICGSNGRAYKLVREFLRALGGSLVAIGATAAILINEPVIPGRHRTLAIVLLLVVPSEGINAVAMYRVGSPFFVPLVFIVLTVVGVLLAWH
jgi:hypothetical protein